MTTGNIAHSNKILHFLSRDANEHRSTCIMAIIWLCICAWECITLYLAKWPNSSNLFPDHSPLRRLFWIFQESGHSWMHKSGKCQKWFSVLPSPRVLSSLPSRGREASRGQFPPRCRGHTLHRAGRRLSVGHWRLAPSYIAHTNSWLHL